MSLFESRVIANVGIADEYYRMDFDWPGPAPRPGQFFTVRVSDSPTPLLRRPFGFSACANGVASMIYWRRGPGTSALAGRAAGDALGVMGPLGNEFPRPASGRRPVLIAGGVGIGPILYFANALAAKGYEPLLLIGARSGKLLPRIETASGVTIERATDDGSVGYHGTVIDLLTRSVDLNPQTVELYLCGPDRMLRAGAERADAAGIQAWVSMEQTMGCGVGACMGCAVHVHGEQKYARVCTEGPIFRSTEIAWQ